MKNKINVLITGINGLLGVGLIKTKPDWINIIYTHNKSFQKKESNKLDITDQKNVLSFFNKNQIDVVIHAASIGSVDICEKNKSLAKQVNILGTRNILRACKNHNTHMVFISSNAVFDGLEAPYNEFSKINPVNYYGETKAVSENEIKSANIKFTIVRLVLMYGWNNINSRPNPVTWLIDRLSKNEKTALVNDTYVNPIYNLQAGETIWKLIEKEKVGLYHLAGAESINRFDFGMKTAEIFGKNKDLLSETDSSYFPSIAPRMPDTTYDLTKIKREIGYVPLNIEQGLTKMFRDKL